MQHILKEKWISEHIPWEIKNGKFVIIIKLNNENKTNFDYLESDRVYITNTKIRNSSQNNIIEKSSYLSKVPQNRNIDGTLSIETLLMEFASNEIKRQDLFNSDISLEIGSIIESDHPILHVEIKG